MKESIFEFSGSMNVRHVTLDVVCSIAYDHDVYLDIREMLVASNRRGAMISASPRLIEELQNSNWDFLYDQAMDHARAQAAMYAADLEEIGCMKATEMMERRAEREVA